MTNPGITWSSASIEALFPGTKPMIMSFRVAYHFCSKGDLILAINTITALKAAIKNGRNCIRIVSDRENFERIKFSVAEETKELRRAARPL